MLYSSRIIVVLQVMYYYRNRTLTLLLVSFRKIEQMYQSGTKTSRK